MSYEYISSVPQFDSLLHSQISQSSGSASIAYSSERADQLPDNLLPSIAEFLYIAVLFFLIGLGLGKQQQGRNDPIAIWQQQVQTLERIWRSTADHKD